MNTRALHGLTARRISDNGITLEYVIETDAGDGSSDVIVNVIPLNGSVNALQPKDIERLERAGIFVKNGISIVISECPEEQPDRIIYNNKIYRVINWTFEYSYTFLETNYGTVVTTCDEMTIQNATFEAPSGSGL